MDHRPLGTTGMQVSPLCLGAMMFGEWGEPDHDECARIIHAALDAGINFVDTADVYSQGESEEIVGKALAGGRRDSVILATKVNGPMDTAITDSGGGDPNKRGSSRRWIVREIEDSLRRLRTDWIDLYQVHLWDPAAAHEETLAALTDLRAQGKIRAFGTSNYPAHAIVEAQWSAQRHGLGRFVSEQPPYSMLIRGVEADILPVAGDYDMGVMPWSPLAGGWLTGRKKTEGESTIRKSARPALSDMSLPENQRKAEAAEQLGALAGEAGLSLIHLALAFCRSHPAVTAPIIGPRTMAHLESQIGAAEVTLSSDVLDRIDQIVPPGTDFTAGERSFVHPALTDAGLRRRSS